MSKTKTNSFSGYYKFSSPRRCDCCGKDKTVFEKLNYSDIQLCRDCAALEDY